MTFWTEIDLRNLFIDIAITMLALNYLDISGFVEWSLPLFVGFLVILQSFLLFLMWGSRTFEDVEKIRGVGIVRTIKEKVSLWLTAFILFSWILSFLWVMVPIQYLQNETGQYFYWSARISVVVGIATGLIMLIRHFATEVEKKQIEEWEAKPEGEKTLVEKIIVPTYDFFIYGNFGNESLRTWLAFVLGFAFLVYTETVFEIVVGDRSIPLAYLVAAVFVSYLPMRLLMVVRPPFSLTELITATAAFGVFLYTLVAKTLERT